MVVDTVNNFDFCITPIIQESWYKYYRFIAKAFQAMIIISFGAYTLKRNEDILGAPSKKLIYFHFICSVCLTLACTWPMFVDDLVWSDDLDKKITLSHQISALIVSFVAIVDVAMLLRFKRVQV